jgi:hypothetical protein
MVQREQLQAKPGQYNAAKGLEAAAELPRRDPFVAYEAVFAQLRTFASQAPVMDATAEGLNNLSSGISTLNDAVKPGGWLYDFGKEAKARWETTKKEFDALKNVGSRVLEWDKKTGIDPTWLGLGKQPYPAAEDPMGADYSAKAFRSKEYWGGLGREGASAASAARLRREAEAMAARSPAFTAPGVSQTMTYGTGISGTDDGNAGQASVSVSGTVEGEANVKIKIEAPELIKAYYEAINAMKMVGQIRNTNGPGSTGRSSPDAQAPAGTGFSGVW